MFQKQANPEVGPVQGLIPGRERSPIPVPNTAATDVSRDGDARTLLAGIRKNDPFAPAGANAELAPFSQQKAATDIVVKGLSQEDRRAYEAEKAQYDAQMEKFLGKMSEAKNTDLLMMVKSRSSEMFGDMPSMGPTMRRVQAQAKELVERVGNEVKASMSEAERQALTAEDKAQQKYLKDICGPSMNWVNPPETPVTDKFMKLVSDRLKEMQGQGREFVGNPGPSEPLNPDLVELRDLLRRLVPAIERLAEGQRRSPEQLQPHQFALGQGFAGLVEQLQQERTSPLPLSMRPSTETVVGLGRTLGRVQARSGAASDADQMVLQA